MTDKAAVADAIKAAPAVAAEALLAGQAGQADPLTLAGIEVGARSLHRNVEDLAADEIERLGLLTSFATAMKIRGVRLDSEDASIADANFDSKILEAFLPLGRAFRCRVLVDGKFSGS